MSGSFWCIFVVLDIFVCDNVIKVAVLCYNWTIMLKQIISDIDLQVVYKSYWFSAICTGAFALGLKSCVYSQMSMLGLYQHGLLTSTEGFLSVLGPAWIVRTWSLSTPLNLLFVIAPKLKHKIRTFTNGLWSKFLFIPTPQFSHSPRQNSQYLMPDQFALNLTASKKNFFRENLYAWPHGNLVKWVLDFGS